MIVGSPRRATAATVTTTRPVSLVSTGRGDLREADWEVVPMNRPPRLLLVCLPVVVALLGLVPATVGGAAPARTVTASARCLATSGANPATVEVTIANRSGDSIRVGYVHGFTTPQAFSVLMRTVDPGPVKGVTIQDGATQTVRAAWDDVREGEGYFGAALVVTSAGVLVPTCGDRAADADTLTLGPAPDSPSAAKREQVEIAARMIGQLESWRAYPALYSLLHPDAQAVVPFAAVACWYAGQYGLPGTADDHVVRSTEITGVTFDRWVYPVTSKPYDAAAVAYRQEIGSVVKSETVDGTEHLVKKDGLWRWFFGTDPDSVANLTTECDLGAGGSAADTGSIEVDFFDCQPGMTPATFDPADCSPLPAGFTFFVLTPGPDVDANRLPGGPIIAISAATALGNGRFVFADLPFGSYDIGPGNNYDGPLFVAPGFGPPLGTTGPGASTYRVTIDAAAPEAVIAFYRLSRGIG
jgi:hypothetical protein